MNYTPNEKKHPIFINFQTAMRLLTNETNYKVTIEVSTKAIRALKKVIRRGVGQYQPGSKTDQLITSFKEVKQEYDEMILKMDIKMVPSKADYVIECWLKKDAAEKAAKESKDRKALKNAARKAEKNAHEESSYFRVDDPEPEPQNIYRIDPIIEIYVWNGFTLSIFFFIFVLISQFIPVLITPFAIFSAQFLCYNEPLFQ